LHKNNFDFLRLLFATLVIVTHSYSLLGFEENDLFMQISKTHTFSYFAVRGFFVISGYLIFQSLIRSNSLVSYFWNRFLRLFPALLVVLLLTVVFGFFLFNGTLYDYINTSTVQTYIPKNLSLYFLQYPLKNDIFKDNPLPLVINGSLWTLRFEFSMYLLLSFLFIFRKNKNVINISLFSLFFIAVIGVSFFEKYLINIKFLLNWFQLFELGIYFISGSILASLNFNKFKYKKQLLLVLLVLFLILMLMNKLNYIIFIILPLLVILFGLCPLKYINNLTVKIGDLSYGVYIYAFPVQQTLICYFHPSINELIFYTTFLVYILAYLSWHLIEKNALKYKKIFSKRKV
jgi:peptidoglycan/LPS O-acetylase OafA/YrhL